MPIELDEVRRRILIALFSDDDLMDALVLKGGNALAIVHRVGARASVDMDFSMPSAFADSDQASSRIFATLKREFGAMGYVVFDERFSLKPSTPGKDQPSWWGGYLVEFKLASKTLFERYGDNLPELRRRSEELGPQQKRKYTIDISRDEFCEGKVRREIDDYAVYVYSLEMIAAEKLRAICQQMPQYAYGNKTARARDFYDIHQIVKENGIDLTTPENLELLAAIFAAKRVPLELLSEIHKHQAFHAPDWPSVEASISGAHQTFDTYFDFVVALASGIEAARKK
jgi:predicted nucleotidyltransferase component of viral defense system